MTSPRRTAALELGGTHVCAAWVDLEAARVEPDTMIRCDLPARQRRQDLVATIVGTARGLAAEKTTVWGIAVPGPFDYASGIAQYHGVGKFDALRGFDLGASMRDALSGGADTIHFVNDAEAFGIGEWVAGAAGRERAIGITLGTGVGSAFLVDGAAVTAGPGVPEQGDIHRVTVAGSPLEEVVSRPAIRRRYAILRGDEGATVPDVKDIAEKARAGDEVAIQAIEQPMEVLGEVLAPRALAFEATVLVVGGSIARSWDVIEPPLRAGLNRASPGWAESFRVAPAKLFDAAPLLGAAWFAERAR